MLQYATPSTTQTFSKSSSVFVEPASRSANTASQSFESHLNGHSNRRPPSTSSESQRSDNRSSRSFGGLADSDSSTALSQLASLAAQAPAATMNISSSSSERYVQMAWSEALRKILKTGDWDRKIVQIRGERPCFYEQVLLCFCATTPGG